MNCPLCIDQTLDVTHHGGIEIDVCPKCRGIWLDRGELERLAKPQDAAPSARSAPIASSSGATPREFDAPKKPKASKSEGKKGESKKSKKKSKKKSLAYKLGDVLEEVLDL